MKKYIVSLVLLMAATLTFAQDKKDKKEGLKRIDQGRSDNISVIISDAFNGSFMALDNLKDLEDMDFDIHIPDIDIDIPDFDFDFDFSHIDVHISDHHFDFDHHIDIDIPDIDIHIPHIDIDIPDFDFDFDFDETEMDELRKELKELKRELKKIKEKNDDN